MSVDSKSTIVGYLVTCDRQGFHAIDSDVLAHHVEFWCPNCAKVVGTDPPEYPKGLTPIYLVNIAPYSQVCDACGALLHDGLKSAQGGNEPLCLFGKHWTAMIGATGEKKEESNVPNLDAMTREDLLVFWGRIPPAYGARPLRKTAAEIFPNKPEGYCKATMNLGHYAINKAVAMKCRLEGCIENALLYEKICDTIYSELPEWARW